MKLHYLSSEEEDAIKATIPWHSIDPGARELVLLANKVDGIATVQSCAGHIDLNEDHFSVQASHIAFRATRERALEVLFDLAPRVGILDVSLRYWLDGSFWICVESDPAEKFKLYELFRMLQATSEGAR